MIWPHGIATIDIVSMGQQMGHNRPTQIRPTQILVFRNANLEATIPESDVL